MQVKTQPVVILTGANGNLGKAVAKKIISRGYNIVLADRNLSKSRSIFNDIIKDSDQILSVKTDILDNSSVKNMIEEAQNKFGKVDILINTVGGYKAGLPLHQTTYETWKFMMDLNALSVFSTSKHVIPLMIEQQRGKIINISSRAGVRGGANDSAYSAAKSAVIRLTESMSAELKKYNINVNCILPGTIDTPENRIAMPDRDYSKWVTPESLADVILFLCSEDARDIHGAAIPVFGKS